MHLCDSFFLRGCVGSWYFAMQRSHTRVFFALPKADEPLRGPFLGAVAATYKRRDLAESVLLPSKTIAQGFVTNVFELKNGKTLTGFVTQESAARVMIRDGEGKEIDIRVADIEERTKSPVSVMPEGLVNKLSVKEFASLLDYLESLAKQ